jgi:hypothetical protein
MTTAERAAAPLLPELPARRPDAPGQFALANADRSSVRGRPDPAEADDVTRTRVIEAIRPAFEPYVHGADVRFTAACWLITARE